MHPGFHAVFLDLTEKASLPRLRQMSFVRMPAALRSAMGGRRLRLLDLPEVLDYDFFLKAIFGLLYCFGDRMWFVTAVVCRVLSMARPYAQIEGLLCVYGLIVCKVIIVLKWKIGWNMGSCGVVKGRCMKQGKVYGNGWL